MAVFMLLPLLLTCCLIPVMMCLFAFWVWMVIDCATNEPPGNDKIVWILIVVLLNWVGALIYFFARRQPRKRGITPPGFFAPPTQPPPRT